MRLFSVLDAPVENRSGDKQSRNATRMIDDGASVYWRRHAFHDQHTNVNIVNLCQTDFETTRFFAHVAEHIFFTFVTEAQSTLEVSSEAI